MKLDLDMAIDPKLFTKKYDSRDSCQDDALWMMIRMIINKM